MLFNLKLTENYLLFLFFTENLNYGLCVFTKEENILSV